MRRAVLGTSRAIAVSTAAAAGAAMLLLSAAGPAVADPAAPLPAPDPTAPGIYGPLVGGGTMPPPPVVGPDLAPIGGSDPSWWDVPGQIEKAIDTWFGDLVKSALEPVLHLVGSTLMSSPNVADGRVAQVWTGVLITANTLYVLLVLAGAVIVMGHETVQTSYSFKQLAPRIVIGAVASNGSLWAISQTVSLGNALAAALMNGPLSTEGVGSRLTSLTVDKIFVPGGGLFLVLLGGAIAVMGLVLLVTCLLRAAILLVLTAGAPLALACHALPQTDPLAKLWWRAILACLATQVGQALALITCCQIFFDPNADDVLGLPSGGGLVDLLLCLVLFFVLAKIPVWAMRIALGRRALGPTMVGRLARSALYYRAFTLARSRLGHRPPRPRPRPTPGSGLGSLPPRPGPTPGGGLTPFTGPRGGGPGGGAGGWRPGSTTITVTPVAPEPPADAARTDGAPRPLGPAPRTPLGPAYTARALPPGRSSRLDELQKQHLRSAATPRSVQDPLFTPLVNGVTPSTRPQRPRSAAPIQPSPAYTRADDAVRPQRPRKVLRDV